MLGMCAPARPRRGALFLAAHPLAGGNEQRREQRAEEYPHSGADQSRLDRVTHEENAAERERKSADPHHPARTQLLFEAAPLLGFGDAGVRGGRGGIGVSRTKGSAGVAADGGVAGAETAGDGVAAAGARGSRGGRGAATKGDCVSIPSRFSISRSRISMLRSWPPCAIDLKKAMIAITGSARIRIASSAHSIGIPPSPCRSVMLSQGPCEAKRSYPLCKRGRSGIRDKRT